MKFLLPFPPPSPPPFFFPLPPPPSPPRKQNSVLRVRREEREYFFINPNEMNDKIEFFLPFLLLISYLLRFPIYIYIHTYMCHMWMCACVDKKKERKENMVNP